MSSSCVGKYLASSAIGCLWWGWRLYFPWSGRIQSMTILVLWTHMISPATVMSVSLWNSQHKSFSYYSDVIMGAIASQITSLMIVYSTVYSDEDQRKHQSSTSLAFVRGIHQWLVNSLHKGPVMWKMFPFDDIIMHFHLVHGLAWGTWQARNPIVSFKYMV